MFKVIKVNFDRLRLGIIEIDDQHLVLLHDFDDLLVGLRLHDDNIVQTSAKSLYINFVNHFSFEEKLLKEYMYPWLFIHTKKHIMFLQELKINLKQPKISKINFHLNWFQYHIQVSDNDYLRLFSSNF